MVSKKALKIGAAGIAVSAVAIGLGVGLSKKNANRTKSTSASNLENYDNMCRRLVDGRYASPTNSVFERSNLRDLQWGSDGYTAAAGASKSGASKGSAKGSMPKGSGKGSKGSGKGSKGSGKGSKGSGKGSKGSCGPGGSCEELFPVGCTNALGFEYCIQGCCLTKPPGRCPDDEDIPRTCSPTDTQSCLDKFGCKYPVCQEGCCVNLGTPPTPTPPSPTPPEPLTALNCPGLTPSVTLNPPIAPAVCSKGSVTSPGVDMCAPVAYEPCVCPSGIGSAKGSKGYSSKGSSPKASSKGSGGGKSGSSKGGSKGTANASGGNHASGGSWRSDGFRRNLQWGSDGHSSVAASGGSSKSGGSKGSSPKASGKGSKGSSPKASGKGSKGSSPTAFGEGSKGSCKCAVPVSGYTGSGGMPYAPSICNPNPLVTPAPQPEFIVAPTTPSPTPCDANRFFYINEKCTNDVFLMGATSYGSAMECCNVNMGSGSMLSGNCQHFDSCNPEPMITPAPLEPIVTPAPVEPVATPAPTPCESIPFYFTGGVCSNSGTVMSGASGPFDTAMQCCDMNFGTGSMFISTTNGGCAYNDSCNPIVPLVTPAPTSCLAKPFVFTGAVCSNDFSITDPTGSATYNSLVTCCNDNFGSGSSMNGSCSFTDICNTLPPTPAPFNMLSNPPTSGSTPTVSTEVTGPPTVGFRDNNNET